MNCEEKRAKDQIGKTLQAGFASARTRHKPGMRKGVRRNEDDYEKKKNDW